MMLVNGIICLVVSVILLVQIKKTQEIETNQFLNKFVWIYWSILVLISINHLASGVVAPWISGVVNSLGPVTDLLHALAGIILSAYLSKRRQIKKHHEQHERATI